MNRRLWRTRKDHVPVRLDIVSQGDKTDTIKRNQLCRTVSKERFMDNPIQHYWGRRLQKVKKALEANNFDVYIADNKDLAKKMAYDTIIPAIAPKTISWGGSMTFVGTRLYEALRKDPATQCWTPTTKASHRSRVCSGGGNRCWWICSSPAPMPSLKTASWSTWT
jgi:hypothetical protein